MKRYKITIQETGTETRIIGKQWEKGVGPDGEYGYTPETEATREYERTIYTQHVDRLDLVRVINAVNAPQAGTDSQEGE